jgi:pilus assembly protein CpaB
MNRNTRTLIVVAIAIVLAGAASFGVYRAIERIPVREVEVAHHQAVVARRALPLGAMLTKEDVKLVAWPSSDPLPGGFTKVEDVLDRGLIVPILENEPLSESKLAPTEAGAGLPPTIPAGMRAISVKVNEVIGVAGFTVPGTRVDVLAMVRQDRESMSRIVVSNVQVLTSGTRFDQEASRKDGKPIKTTVVTLAVTPTDAERIALAASDGEIILALRNPLDDNPAPTTGVKLASLMSGTTQAAPAPRPPSIAKPKPQPVPAPEPVAAPARIYTVEAIRAAKRSEEPVR